MHCVRPCGPAVIIVIVVVQVVVCLSGSNQLLICKRVSRLFRFALICGTCFVLLLLFCPVLRVVLVPVLPVYIISCTYADKVPHSIHSYT